MENKELKQAPKSAMSTFFKIGDKLTGGDPRKKADFDYYLLWVMFLSFFAIFISNILTGIKLMEVGEVWPAIKSFAWSLVIFAIIWFQYSALKGTWQTRNRIKSLPEINNIKEAEPIEDDTIEEMEKEFE